MILKLFNGWMEKAEEKVRCKDGKYRRLLSKKKVKAILKLVSESRVVEVRDNYVIYKREVKNEIQTF